MGKQCVDACMTGGVSIVGKGSPLSGVASAIWSSDITSAVPCGFAGGLLLRTCAVSGTLDSEG